MHPVPLETFPAVLSGAIESSGLSLEQLQRKLADEGVRVSLSTLSYWRRGRTRPERPESLRAVEAIEEVLNLPHGYLTGLLGPRKPRGRWVARGGIVHPHDELWDNTSGLSSVLLELGEADPGEVTYLQIHDQHHLDHQGRDFRTRVRMLLRSEVDGLGSLVVLHRAEDTDRALPTLSSAVGCAIGRVRDIPSCRFTAGEILLDRQLNTGQTAVIEFEVHWFGATRSVRYVRTSRRPVRDYLVEVNFHPSRLPAQCFAFTQTGADAREIRAETLDVGRYGGVHTSIQGAGLPIVGIRWTW
ncbi:helix-turn-helix domain-containing protein [Actinokineospora enzanensis]|uniref:helix-turn-helix domain-containing protein n=1 Tax=Actinokineospora enzanensis TaxID=155975 RepID=UPI000380ADDF|nr:helix-turn-helix transcriptional regulator [Actinokineospora enzanensis]